MNTKQCISAILLTVLIGGGTASAQSDNKGFTALFDGKTTKDWHTYGKTSAGSKWVVENGALHLNPAAGDKDGGGDLVTDNEYSDFHLKIDWKVAPKANSGIIFYVKEDPAKYKQTYSTGLEMQVLDNEGHDDGKIAKHRSGDLYDLVKSSTEPVKPVGEWNTAEIICKNGKLEHYLNGVKVVSATLWDDNWRALVAGSKFAAWPEWGTYKSGKIALQDHGDEVWYRNIRIKKL